ncbi:MAG: hypothetical protein Q8Q87_00915, partial [Candidatus Omnitrophota bacterium]|nr:hypothetical protein [Candidatus Omnitrophota bacterium]
RWHDGKLSGDLIGIWLANRNDSGGLKADRISGMVSSGEYIETGGGGGVWSAAGGGGWVEVTDLLSQYGMFGPNGLSELNNFVSVPITEVCSNILTAGASACTGSITSATANVTIFTATSPSIMYDIFTISGRGTLSGPLSLTDSARLTYGAENDILLKVTQVDPSTKQFAADLTGILNNQTITSGQVAGPYSDDMLSFVGGGKLSELNE